MGRLSIKVSSFSSIPHSNPTRLSNKKKKFVKSSCLSRESSFPCEFLCNYTPCHDEKYFPPSFFRPTSRDFVYSTDHFSLSLFLVSRKDSYEIRRRLVRARRNHVNDREYGAGRKAENGRHLTAEIDVNRRSVIPHGFLPNGSFE